MGGVDFEVSCRIDLSRLDEITSFDLANTGLGDFYFDGVQVSSVPGSAFVADGSGGFTLTGLSFLPNADVSTDNIFTHSLKTTRTDTGLPHSTELEQGVYICAIADKPDVTGETCLNINEDTEGLMFFDVNLNDVDGSELFTTWETTMISPITSFARLNRKEIKSNPNIEPSNCANPCTTARYYINPAAHTSGNLQLSIRVSSFAP